MSSATGTARLCGVVAAVVLSVKAPVVPAAGDQEIAVQCRFSSGLAATYEFNRADATVRRVDPLQPRHGRVRATAAEYRFIFRDRDGSFRIDVIIDRATGNTRRVFGTRDNMERMPDSGGEKSGLVYEAGNCRARDAQLR